MKKITTLLLKSIHMKHDYSPVDVHQPLAPNIFLFLHLHCFGTDGADAACLLLLSTWCITGMPTASILSTLARAEKVLNWLSYTWLKISWNTQLHKIWPRWNLTSSWLSSLCSVLTGEPDSSPDSGSAHTKDWILSPSQLFKMFWTPKLFSSVYLLTIH